MSRTTQTPTKSASAESPWLTRHWVVRRGAAAFQYGAASVRQGVGAVANLVFPPNCQLCSQDLDVPGQVHVCAACRHQLKNRRPLCWACAMPLPNLASPVTDSCPACRNERFRFTSVQAVGVYDGLLRDAVLRMKKAHEESLTLTMGRVLAESLRFTDPTRPDGSPAQPDRDPARPDRDLTQPDRDPTRPDGSPTQRDGGSLQAPGHPAWPDLVVPVPMHWSRRIARGTNPAEVLAETVAQKLRIPVALDLLHNRRKTRKQGTLLPDQRRRNVREAFSVSAGYDIKDTCVLLIDDVMTTGATGDELSRMLRQAGAKRISVAVLARGTG